MREDNGAEMPPEQDEQETLRAFRFNRDPQWQAHIARYEPIIKKVAIKYCAADEDMREDVMQEARMGLLAVFPEEVTGDLDNYCRNVIRNSILSYLDSYAKGNWYIGRTRHVKDRKTGKTSRRYLPARFSSLDELSDDYGMQVNEDGDVTWPATTEDGIPRENGRGGRLPIFDTGDFE